MERNYSNQELSFIAAAMTGRISRREILKRSAAFGLSAPLISALLAACGTPADPDEDGTTPAGSTPVTTTENTPGTTDSGDTTPSTTDEPALGAELIGELQGPDVILDESQFPTSFSEAPMLAELVEAGELPPVEERISSQPMVVQPVEEIGQYGGTWRRAFTGPGDGENGNRIMSSDKILFWDYTGSEIDPSVARDWEVSEDGTTTTIFLREGMKWSDGEPFTANDFMYWYEHVYQNKDLVPTPTPEMSINGQPGTMEMVDDYTVRFVFPEPYPMFVDVLAGSTQMGGGLSTRGDVLMGAYAPAHYLEQYHPDFVDQAELDQIASDEGYDNWVNLYKFKNTWRLNPDLPVISPWKTVIPINNPTWELERNPYYWAVDTEGNQLPYIDKIIMTMAEDLEVIGLRAMAGEIDWQARHMELPKLPVFLENQEAGDYKVYLDTAFYGSDSSFHFNQSFNGDEEIAKWIQNRDFRRAFSLGIDRDQLNEAFWLGLGTPGSPIPADNLPQNPGPEYRTMWSTYDPDQANELLDGIGLTEKDQEGFRLRTDNGQRLRIQVITVTGSFVNFAEVAEMVAQQVAQIGIQLDISDQERSLAMQRAEANEHHMFVWVNDGSEHIFLYPHHALPVGAPNAMMGPAHSAWYASNGERGIEPGERMKEAQELYSSAFGVADREEQDQIAQEIWKILVEEQFTVGTVGLSPAVMGVRIVKNNMGNVPERHANGQHVRTPCTSHPPTFFFRS